MSNSIKNYLDQTKKRPRGNGDLNISPEKKKLSMAKITDMNAAEMINLIKSAVSELNLASKEDLNCFKTEIGLEIEEVRRENTKLKEELISAKQELLAINNKIENMDNKIKENNLIIRGITYDEKDSLTDVVKEFCTNLLECPDVSINQVYPIGNPAFSRGCRPLLIKFNCNSDVNRITANCRKLKGTDFVVHRDFNIDTQMKRKKLNTLRKRIISLNKEIKAVVRYDYILINNEKFKFSRDGLLLWKNENGLEKLKEVLDVNDSTASTLLEDTGGGGRTPTHQSTAPSNPSI